MRRESPRFGGLRLALKALHPVDKALLVFMAVLMAQSMLTMFFPRETPALSGDIDVVVRTSAAAVFGYFLSANFVGRHSPKGQAAMEEEGEGESVRSDFPRDGTGHPSASPFRRRRRSSPGAFMQRHLLRAVRISWLRVPISRRSPKHQACRNTPRSRGLLRPMNLLQGEGFPPAVRSRPGRRTAAQAAFKSILPRPLGFFVLWPCCFCGIWCSLALLGRNLIPCRLPSFSFATSFRAVSAF